MPAGLFDEEAVGHCPAGRLEYQRARLIGDLCLDDSGIRLVPRKGKALYGYSVCVSAAVSFEGGLEFVDLLQDLTAGLFRGVGFVREKENGVIRYAQLWLCRGMALLTVATPKVRISIICAEPRSTRQASLFPPGQGP